MDKMKFPKLPHRYVVYDKLHKGAVFAVVSFTAIVAIRMGVELVHCMTVQRPLVKEKRRYLKEIEFEERRAEREIELRKQAELQAAVDSTKKK